MTAGFVVSTSALRDQSGKSFQIIENTDIFICGFLN